VVVTCARLCAAPVAKERTERLTEKYAPAGFTKGLDIKIESWHIFRNAGLAFTGHVDFDFCLLQP